MLCCVYEYKTFRHFIKLCYLQGILYIVIKKINRHFHWQNLFPGFQVYYMLGFFKVSFGYSFEFPSSNHRLLLHKRYLAVSEPSLVSVTLHLPVQTSPEIQTCLGSTIDTSNLRETKAN